MAQSIQVGPVTRIEGHLDIETTLAAKDGRQRVAEARSAGTMFRGFEKMLQGRDPRDAVPFTQRICGVCPVPHGMAAALALETAAAAPAPANGRILRNLVLGANFIQSHLLHFYHLALLDYVDAAGRLDAAPWTPRYTGADMLRGSEAAGLLADYVAALEIRRKADQMGAIFAGKLPHCASFVPGGCSAELTAARVEEFRALLKEVTQFVADRYVRDVEALAKRFPDYFKIGRGCGNLLAFGAFDQDARGSKQFLRRGRYTDGQDAQLDAAQIAEHVQHARYAGGSGAAHPAAGATEPQLGKAGAYSWIKAPRYAGKPHETGPLARMWIGGDYRNGISVLDRLLARAFETRKIAQAMGQWLNELTPRQSARIEYRVPQSAAGVGLTEAPRGALGHWLQIRNGTVGRYQIITPTAWNASPRDDSGQAGPLEQALVGTPIENPEQPIEVLRVVHSFDPCLACSVH